MRTLERYVTALTTHPWTILLAVGVVTVALSTGLPKLETDFDMEGSLPDDHPYIQVDRRIRAEFGGRNTIIVAIIPREGDVWRPAVLSVVRDVTLTALRLPGVMAHSVVSLAAPSVRHVEDVGGALTVDYLMREVPESPEDIARLRARLESNPQLRGMLVTPDQRAALVMLDFWPDEDHAAIAERVQALVAPYADAPVDFYFAGEPMLAFTQLEQTATVARRIPITFAVIAAMLLISFRSVQGMLIPMLTATLSVLWAFGLMGHTGIAIDAWNAAVPILLIAVAAAHSAQMLKRYVEELVRLGDNRAAVIESTTRIGPVMIAAGGTAGLGFASLALFGVPSIANFGLACAYGIASAVILEMTFIPALRAILPAPRRLPGRGGLTQHVLDSVERGIVRRRGAPVLIGSAVALLIAGAGAAQIRTYGPTREYMPKDSMARRHLEVIEQHFEGTVTMTLLYEGEPGTAKTATVLRHMAALQAELERDPLVTRTASLADLVKSLHETFNPEDAEPYRVPESQELVAQLMFLGDSPAFERFTDRARSTGLLVAYLRTDDSALVGPLVRHTSRWLEANPPPEGVRVLVAGGAGPIVLAVNEHTTIGKLINTAVILLTIYLVSSVVLRSALGGVYVITPIVVSTVLLFGVLGWTGIRLDMASATVIAMAAGIGADYAIYFIYRLREERARTADDFEALHRALDTSGRAILFVAASIGAGFVVIAISPFHGLRLFGSLMPTAMLFSSLASISLMPVLVMRTRPTFIFGDAPAAPVPEAGTARAA